MSEFGVLKVGHVVRFSDRWGNEQVGVAVGPSPDDMWTVWVPLGEHAYGVYPSRVEVIAGLTPEQRLYNIEAAEKDTRQCFEKWPIWQTRFEEDPSYRFYGRSIDQLRSEVR